MSRGFPPRLARADDSQVLRVLRQDVALLHRLLQQAWCRETSQDPRRWTPRLPEYAQCGATALVVQDVVGGALLFGRYVRDGEFLTHCWNVFDGAVEIDLTRRQLVGARRLGFESITRDALLSNEPTAYRYAYLAARLAVLARRSPRRWDEPTARSGPALSGPTPPSPRAPTSRPAAPRR
jgi:hypothetical protein